MLWCMHIFQSVLHPRQSAQSAQSAGPTATVAVLNHHTIIGSIMHRLLWHACQCVVPHTSPSPCTITPLSNGTIANTIFFGGSAFMALARVMAAVGDKKIRHPPPPPNYGFSGCMGITLCTLHGMGKLRILSKHCCTPPPSKSYALVQGTAGIGTVLIWYVI